MHFGTAQRLLGASIPLLALAPLSVGQSLTRVPALGGRSRRFLRVEWFLAFASRAEGQFFTEA